MNKSDLRGYVQSILNNDDELREIVAAKYPDEPVSARRAHLAGCCAAGTHEFILLCFPRRTEGTLAELLCGPVYHEDPVWGSPEWRRNRIAESTYRWRKVYINKVAAYVLTTALLRKPSPVLSEVLRTNTKGWLNYDECGELHCNLRRQAGLANSPASNPAE